MTEWNAYKVFANGKRAKKPQTTFSNEDPDFFFEEILPTLTEKMRRSKWVVVDASGPQDRPAQSTNSEEDLKKKKINYVIYRKILEDHSQIMDKKIYSALMMNENTEWKWAWCLVQPATNNFISMISEGFESYKEAVSWIDTTYEAMAS
jgi:hypothetical protein